MHSDQTITALATTFGLMVVVGLFQFVLLPTIVEVFRQRIFGLRRELLLLAADRKIAFDSNAYRNLMQILNGLLRFAERVTFLRGMVTGVTDPAGIRAFQERIGEAIKDESPEVRGQLRKIHARAARAVGDLVVSTSPVLWCALVLVFAAGIVYAVSRGLGSLGRTWARVVTRLPLGAIEADVSALEGCAA